MSQGFDDAQAYTDQKISDLIDGAPALLDTLNELAAAIGDDENFASNILTAVSNETAARQAADTAEANARSSADTALQSDIDQEILDRQAAVSAEASAREAADTAEAAARTAELPRFAKMRTTLTSTDISNGYVNLDHAVLDNSVHVFLDRLACHVDDDYTLSVVNGVTRVTFTSSFKNSEEGPGSGDLFRCNYAYKNSDQSVGGGGGGGGGGGPTQSITLNSVSAINGISWVPFSDTGMVKLEEYNAATDTWVENMFIMSPGDGFVYGTPNAGYLYRIAEYVSGSLYQYSNSVTATFS
jgi:hypothetical protein